MPSFSIDDGSFREAQHCLEQLLHRSAVDLAFRRQLLTDPQTAIEAHLGKTFGAALNIQFIENHADATIVLPDYHGDELTEEEQEAVSGGISPVSTHEVGLVRLSLWLKSSSR